MDNNDKSVTGPLVYIPNDAVAEFSILQNQFSPEFGHSSGGQFNTVIVSGTNTFHGRLYEYLQNRNLNASRSAASKPGVFTSNPALRQQPLRRTSWRTGLQEQAVLLRQFRVQPSRTSFHRRSDSGPNCRRLCHAGRIPGLSQSNITGLQQYAVAPSACTAAQISSVFVRRAASQCRRSRYHNPGQPERHCIRYASA